MRYSYQACTKHHKTYCTDPVCKREEYGHSSYDSSDNAGQVGITADGHLGIGVGGGVAIDMSDGGLDLLL